MYDLSCPTLGVYRKFQQYPIFLITIDIDILKRKKEEMVIRSAIIDGVCIQMDVDGIFL